MPDPSVQAYLAQHYLSGPKADAILARHQQAQSSSSIDGEKKKKRRKKVHTTTNDDNGSSSALRMRDDDEDWKRSHAADEDDEDDYRGAQVVKEAKRQQFKKGGWANVGSSEDPRVANEDQEEEGDGPQFVGDDGSILDPIQAADSIRAQQAASAGPSQPRSGLRTKEQVREERLAKERQAKLAAEEARKSRGGQMTAEEEEAFRLAHTVVERDSSGRKIDVAARKAEEEAREVEREAKRKKKELEKDRVNKGERQYRENLKRQEEAGKVEKEGVARYANDERMNQQLKEVERADDPALAFLTKKRPKGPQLPKYKGPTPPTVNRFGIQPGYRWDGVDRGNGFEKKLQEARERRERRAEQERDYDPDDEDD